MVARRRGTVLAGAALVAALLAIASARSAPARQDSLPVSDGNARNAALAVDRPPSTAVGVSAREYRLTAYRTSVPRGIVRFNLANYGEDRHDLVVRDRDGRELARSQEVRSGARTTVRVRLAAGRYRLVCDLSDHERRGMRTSILVTRPVRR